MFYKYELRKKGDKRVLYIYMSSTFEEANEFRKQKNTNLEEKILRFIKNNNIDYNEGPVYIISNGIIIKSVDINNKEINIEELIGIDNYKNKNFIVKIEKNNIIDIINLEEFLLSILMTNYSNEISDETLKCLTILYRTYAYKKMNERGYIEENNQFLTYKNLSYYKVLYFNEYEKIVSKLKMIINETDCMFITYNNLFIEPYVHLVNNGYTDTKDNILYLEKVRSLWDLLSPFYITKTRYNMEEMIKIFKCDKKDIFNIKIKKLNTNGQIEKVEIGNKVYSGSDFIKALRLPSLDMTIIINNTDVYFINRGYGNNLGLSLEGSKYLASVGCNFLQILKYYFPKCIIKKYV